MTTDIRARLVLDDAATRTIGMVSGGLDKMNHQVHRAQHELASMAKQALAVAFGFQLSGAVDTFKEIAGEAFHAAEGAQEQQKALAGILSTVDKTGASYEDTLEKATELHGSLEDMGIAAGVATDAVIEAFETIASRSQRPQEEIEKLVQQMTHAGRAVHGGMGAIAGAMRDLEMGIIRPRNALVQLMLQTKTVSGTAKDVAKGLSKMVQDGKVEEAFKLAETAIGKMSQKMKDAPLSFSAVKQSLKDIRENFFEAMGVPMLASLTPPLNRLRMYLIENRVAIEHFAVSVGTRVGVWIGEAATKIQEGFEYLKTHAHEIKEALEKGAELIKKSFKFILEHKEELAIAFGVRALGRAGGLGGGGAEAGGVDIPGAIKGIIDFGKKMAEMGVAQPVSSLGDKVPMLSAGLGMSVIALGAFGLALASLTAMLWQVKKLADETRSYGTKGDNDARMTAMKKYAETGNVAEAKDLHKKWGSSGDLNDIATAQLVEALEQQAIRVAAANNQWEAQVRAFADHALTGAEGADSLVEEFNTASKSGNDARKQFIVDQVAGQKEVGIMFMSLSESMAGSMEAFIAEVMKVDLYAGMKMREAADAAKKDGTKPKGMTTNFNGGQTFNIKQDFRNEDPDRIALVFRRDLLKAAESRRQSRLATPFGL